MGADLFLGTVLTRAAFGGEVLAAGFRGITVFRVFFFAAAVAALGFAFDAPAFDALCARALPAGERLVAGFNRVDFAAVRFRVDEAVAPRLEDDRGETFFRVLATGLLI
jgi:hypothetical protein